MHKNKVESIVLNEDINPGLICSYRHLEYENEVPSLRIKIEAGSSKKPRKIWRWISILAKLAFVFLAGNILGYFLRSNEDGNPKGVNKLKCEVDGTNKSDMSERGNILYLFSTFEFVKDNLYQFYSCDDHIYSICDTY